MKHYCETAAAVLQQMESTADGLSTAEAARRQEQYGKNKLAEGKKDSLLVRFFKQMTDPMILILAQNFVRSFHVGFFPFG